MEHGYEVTAHSIVFDEIRVRERFGKIKLNVINLIELEKGIGLSATIGTLLQPVFRVGGNGFGQVRFERGSRLAIPGSSLAIKNRMVSLRSGKVVSSV